MKGYNFKYLSANDDIINNKVDLDTIPKCKDCLHKKRVIQYDKDHNIINIYDSIDECAEKLDLVRCTVRKYCNGKPKKYANINLKFSDDTDDMINKKVNISIKEVNENIKTEFDTNKQVSVYNKNDNSFVETMNDHREIAQKYGLKQITILKHCRKEIKYSKSPYIFRFA